MNDGYWRIVIFNLGTESVKVEVEGESISTVWSMFDLGTAAAVSYLCWSPCISGFLTGSL